MDVLKKEFADKKRNSEVMRAFGSRMFNQFSVWKSYRRNKELEWMESLRQYKGLYDPEVRIDPNNSKVYPKITRSKVNIVLSRLHEMLFPELERNWEIFPPPEPRVPKEVVMQIVQSMIKIDPQTGKPQVDEQGQLVLPSVDQIKVAVDKYADEACGKMSNVIDDQLHEMDYSEETKKILKSGLLYGPGLAKGPLITHREKRKWVADVATGEFKEDINSEELPFFESTRLWDWYGDMSVVDMDKIEGSYERNIMNKHDLRNLMKRKDFYYDIIEEVLKESPNGDYVPEPWEIELQVIEVEAGVGRRTGVSSTAVTGTYDAGDMGATNRRIGKKYEVLEFWGLPCRAGR